MHAGSGPIFLATILVSCCTWGLQPNWILEKVMRSGTLLIVSLCGGHQENGGVCGRQSTLKSGNQVASGQASGLHPIRVTFIAILQAMLC